MGCFGCNTQLIGGESFLCTVCRHQLPLTDFNFSQTNPVDETFFSRVPITKAAAFMYFRQNGVVKSILYYLKYKNQESIGEFIGEWYGQLLQEDKGLPKIDYVVPVPLHTKKLKKRGYNQVHTFAQALAKKLNTNFLPNLLLKTANTKTQSKNKRFTRASKTQKLYVLNPRFSLKASTILLVDDVITTGATIEACANALLQLPNINLFVTSIAYVPKQGL